MTQTEDWKQFICRACGLIYDEKSGDPDSGIAPGTRFADIPQDWVCPLCGVVKDDFEPYETPAIAQVATHGALRRKQVGVVIVGAGQAGWAAAEAVRAQDASIPITMVTACSGDRYLKPELSIALRRQASRASLVREGGLESAERLGVRLMADTYAVGLSPVLRQLRTTRGVFHYTDLILAQGARAVLPEGMPPQLCWRINDLEAWVQLKRKLAGSSKVVVIIGAGMIGCELADDFASVGHQVVLLDTQAAPLAGLLPERASHRLRQALEAASIRFFGAVKVADIKQLASGARQVTTECGQVFVCDEIVAAMGLATDTRLALDAKLTIERGIAVDPHSLQTSAEHVYALGDCVSIEGAPCRFIEPIARQAQAIAHAMAGQPDSHYVHSPPVIRLKTPSLPVVLHGLPEPQGEWFVTEDTDSQLKMVQRIQGRDSCRLELG